VPLGSVLLSHPAISLCVRPLQRARFSADFIRAVQTCTNFARASSYACRSSSGSASTFTPSACQHLSKYSPGVTPRGNSGPTPSAYRFTSPSTDEATAHALANQQPCPRATLNTARDHRKAFCLLTAYRQ